MRLELWRIDPEGRYTPDILVTDDPDSLRVDLELGRGEDLRSMFRGRPHAAVAYVLSSTHRGERGLRAAYCPLIAFERIPEDDLLLRILNCCKWTERLLESDWTSGGRRYHVFACRLTERYLLEFVYGLYRTGGFVIPGHLGDDRASPVCPPYHVDLAHGRALGLDGEAVAELRLRDPRGLTAAIGGMSDRERAEWGLPPIAV